MSKMNLDGMALLVRSGGGARDTGMTDAPPRSGRRRANNMGAVNERLRGLLREATGRAEVSGRHRILLGPLHLCVVSL